LSRTYGSLDSKAIDGLLTLAEYVRPGRACFVPSPFNNIQEFEVLEMKTLPEYCRCEVGTWICRDLYTGASIVGASPPTGKTYVHRKKFSTESLNDKCLPLMKMIGVALVFRNLSRLSLRRPITLISLLSLSWEIGSTGSYGLACCR
jgi:hypothetical protein